MLESKYYKMKQNRHEEILAETETRKERVVKTMVLAEQRYNISTFEKNHETSIR